MSDLDISIKVEGAKELADLWGKLPTDLRLDAYDTFDKAGRVVEGQSKLQTPVDTGRLRGSINSKVEVYPDLRAIISPHTNYAIFVHQGTRYTKGRPYMTNGYEAGKGRIEQLLKNLLFRIVGRMKR